MSQSPFGAIDSGEVVELREFMSRFGIDQRRTALSYLHKLQVRYLRVGRLVIISGRQLQAAVERYSQCAQDDADPWLEGDDDHKVD